jgi:hypothetical protein
MPSCLFPGVFHNTSKHPGVTAYEVDKDAMTDNVNGHWAVFVGPPVASSTLNELHTANSSSLNWHLFFHLATTPCCSLAADSRFAIWYAVSLANSIP